MVAVETAEAKGSAMGWMGNPRKAIQDTLKSRFERLGRVVGKNPKTTIGCTLLFTLAVSPLFLLATWEARIEYT
jgi:hypothetical protein